MGVKSTRDMTRVQAEALYVSAKLEAKREKYQRKVRRLTNKALEDVLEELNDKEYDGQGFENYHIT